MNTEFPCLWELGPCPHLVAFVFNDTHYEGFWLVQKHSIIQYYDEEKTWFEIKWLILKDTQQNEPSLNGSTSPYLFIYSLHCWPF